MKKLIILLAVLLLLTGCQQEKKSFSQQFAETFACDENNRAVELKGEDFDFQVTHGTHVILLANKDNDVNKQVEELVQAVNNHNGMVIYFFDTAKQLPADQLTQLQKAIDAFMENPQPWNSEQPIVLFVKQGELLEVYNVKQSGYELYDSQLTAMENNSAPGCNDC